MFHQVNDSMLKQDLTICFFVSVMLIGPAGAQNDMLQLEARQQTRNDQDFQESITTVSLKPQETAIIVCDMWDQHWCQTATARVKAMSPEMNEVLKRARRRGITIIHAPSSTMDYYMDFPQRKKLLGAPHDASSDVIEDWYALDPDREGPLPVDDSDGGCDDPNSDCVNCAVWKKQIDLLEIEEADGISDDGKEINNYFHSLGIKNVLLMGVHTNMCVLGRPFGIRSHIAQGRKVLLVRDLTDAMYNPKMPPYVTHQKGTDLIINHIEKYWCPTITSDQIK